MQSSRVRLSVTALNQAWRAQDGLKGHKSLSFASTSTSAPPPFLPSVHLSIHPSSAPASPGRGLCVEGVRQAAQAGAPASCRDQLGPGALMSAGLFAEGQESSEPCGGGGSADRALLIERSWKPAVTGHWGSPKLPPELICLQCFCAVYRVLLSNAQAGEKIMTTKNNTNINATLKD